MIYVAAAILTDIFFITLNMIWMRLRRRDIATRAILALYIFAVPVFFAIAAIYMLGKDPNLSPEYWKNVGIWAGLCFLTNFINLYTFKFVSLTEISTYRFTITVILALLFDYFFLETPLSYGMLGVIILTLIGGTLLNFERRRFIEKQREQEYAEKMSRKTQSLFVTLSSLVVISALTISYLYFFKEALSLQDSFLFHAAASQTVLFSLFFAYGGFEMMRSLKSNKVSLLELTAMIVLITLACVTESFAFQGLPVVLIVLLDIFRPLAFSIHDYKTKDVPLTFASVVSCLMIIAGILGISFLQSE